MNKIYFLFCSLLLCSGLTKAQTQQCNTLLPDFSIEGLGDYVTSVNLTTGTPYQFKNISCGLCQYSYYTWTVYPSSGGSATGFTLSSTTAVAPTINFSVPGTYTVKLKIYTTSTSVFYTCGDDTKEITKMSYLKVAYTTPTAQFKTNGSDLTTTTLSLNSIVNFTDYSRNFPTSWQWSVTPSTGWTFSSGSSNSQNPSFKFSATGQYTVALKATNSAGSNTITKINHINILAIQPVADFNANGNTASQISVTQNSAVSLNDLSTNSPANWLWSITPGTGWSFNSGSSSTANPQVKFVTAGTYSISLTASNSGGSNTKTKAGYLSVTPPAPLVTSPVTYCYGSVSVALTATGSNLKWYTSTSGGSSFSTAPTPSTTASTGSKSYYVSQTINGFESPLAQINVIVNSLPTAPGVTSVINYCPGAPALPLSALGTNLTWYTSQTGGTGSASAPVPSTSVIGTINYFVSQKNITNCEGPRAQMSVIVKATLDAPTVVTPVNYCRNAVAIKLTAAGTGLKWYTTPTDGTGSAIAPVPSTISAGTASYYVSQSSIGCPEGPRSKIEVITATDSVPVVPTVSTPVGYLQGDTAMPLMATGNLLKWYAQLTGSIALTDAPVPATTVPGTTSYYVSQTMNGCESQKAKIDVVVNALAPAPPWVWGTGFLPAQQDNYRDFYTYPSSSGKDLATDKNGSSYTTGTYRGAPYINNGQLTLSQYGGLYVVKYDSSGKVVWAKGTGGGTSDYGEGTSVAVDASGNSYITGIFRGTINFGTASLTGSTEYSNFFVAKFNNTGNVIWAKKAFSTATTSGAGIDVDKLGNVYVTGNLYGPTTFENTTVTFSGNSGSFIAKYNFAGGLLWVKTEGAGGFVAVDALGNSYVTGFNNFLTKYNSAGIVNWTKPLTGTSRGIATDFNGNSYVTGSFGTVSYDSSGKVIWQNSTAGYGIAVDSLKNMYLTGGFKGSVSFGRTILTSAGGGDIYVAKYTSSGKLIWVQQSGSTEPYDLGLSMGYDKFGNTYVSAQYGVSTGKMGQIGTNENVFSSIRRIISKIGSGAPANIRFTPAAGIVGTVLNITGTNLSGITLVKFNGAVTGNIISNSSTELTVTVPPGATTGVITITSPAGTSTTSTNFLIYPAAPGVAPDWVWAKKQGELNSDYVAGLDMVTDSSGNNYVIGYFTGTAAFGDTTLTSTTTTAAMFFAKYSKTGKLMWARKIGDRQAANFGDFQSVLLAIDAVGNCYISGEYRGVVYIGDLSANPVAFSNSYNTIGSSDSYTAKFDSSGRLVWARNLGTGTYYETPAAINADKNGNVYVAGQYYGTSNSTAYIAGQSFLGSGYYMVKYNILGQTLWSKKVVQKGASIQAIDNSNLYVAGESSLATYNMNGDVLSTVRVIGMGATSRGEEIRGMSLDAFGNKYITGRYFDTLTIGNSKFRSNGGADIYIAKYDSSNTLLWVQTGGGQFDDRSTGIKTDAIGNSYITGTFNGAAIFGPDTLKGNGENDVFIAKYDRSGQLLWLQKGGGEINDLVYDIGIDANENSYIAGTFNTAAQFTDISVNSTQTNIFIAKLGSNVNTSKTGIVSICPGGDATLKADTTGNNYQWQVNTTQGYINVEDDSTYTGSNSRNLQLNKISGKISGTEYRCLVDGYISNPVQLKISDFWNGYINNAWENSFNWSCSGKVPDANTDVIINSGNVILNSNTIVKSVTIGRGATLTVKPGYKLTVTGK